MQTLFHLQSLLISHQPSPNAATFAKTSHICPSLPMYQYSLRCRKRGFENPSHILDTQNITALSPLSSLSLFLDSATKSFLDIYWDVCSMRILAVLLESHMTRICGMVFMILIITKDGDYRIDFNILVYRREI